MIRIPVKPALNTELFEHFTDLRAAAVHHHRVDARLLQEHEVSSEGFLEVAIDHGMPTASGRWSAYGSVESRAEPLRGPAPGPLGGYDSWTALREATAPLKTRHTLQAVAVSRTDCVEVAPIYTL